MATTPYINFADSQGAVRTHAGTAGWVLLAVAILSAAGLVVLNIAVSQQIADAQAHIESARRGAGLSTQSRRTVSKETADEVAAVNRAARRLAIPWPSLFQALEAATSERIVILALQPNAQQREVRVLGEADDFAAITEFLAALGSQQPLQRARLTSHEIRASGQVQFDIIAEWNLPR
jgi:Tfp pilus assembly protein PilN